MPIERAIAVAVEIDGRQRYLLETDKLQEMLGASQIMNDCVVEATTFFAEPNSHLFQPVSGEIRAWASASGARRAELLNGTWDLRKWLTERGVDHTTACVEVDRRHFEQPGHGIPPEASLDVEPDEASLQWVHRKLSRELARRKQMKSGVDARPICSLFAPCGLHGHDFANQWRPDKDATEPRRQLRSDRAAAKVKAWTDRRKILYETILLEPVWRRVRELTGQAVVTRPIQFRDLSDSQEDSDDGTRDQYLAFLRADGDQLGALLSEINWNSASWNDSREPWLRAAEFAKDLDELTRQAFTAAVVSVAITPAVADDLLAQTARGAKPKLKVSVLPQVIGGDDLWVIAGRREALPLACSFIEEFDRRARSTLESAVRVANESRGGDTLTPTMSVGIAFAKMGYPAHAMADAAEALLRNAKARRRLDGVKSQTQGCLDWHWIESSLVETIDAARPRATDYVDVASGTVMRLTTRPWTVEQCRGFVKLSESFHGISRRKREQLDDVLRRGFELSNLAWEGWWKGLDGDERKAVGTCESEFQRLGCASGKTANSRFCPWSIEKPSTGGPVHETAWVDLLGLDDVLKGVGDPTRETQTEVSDARA